MLLQRQRRSGINLVCDLRSLGLCLAILAASSFAAENADFVWLEGEQPTAVNFKANNSGWGHKEFLSGEKWMHVSVDAAKVDSDVPAGGIVADYAFSIAKDAKHEVWARIGFEFARSQFDWRIDGGDWISVIPEQLTTDLMEIDFWCEVAWLKLGDAHVTKGEHKLQIRLPKTKDDKGKTNRILFALDAICIYPGALSPNSHWKPNETGRDEKDEQAGKNVFALPEPASAEARSSVALEGTWEVCRHDEQMPGEVAEPIKDLPTSPHWKAIAVPGDKNALRPDLLFAHRLWYRTRVNVPASCAGRSFHIVFPQNNLNTTVFVNGVYCGFDKNPYARVQIDVTRGIKPGVNEIWVGIRDAWYGYSTSPTNPLKLRKRYNLPLSYSSQGFQDLSYPVWSHFESGILVTPTFVAAGAVKASDVFCKPSVARKEVALEVTLANPSAQNANGEIACEVVNEKTKQVEKTFAPKAFSLAAGTEAKIDLSEKWENAKLWWPDEPNLYILRATVKVGGKAIDVSETPFGFREWTCDGKNFKLNGIIWHGWADCFTARTPQEWVEFYRKTNQRMMRFWGTRWMDLSPERALDIFDRNGVVVRRSGILDGEAIGYMAIENDPDLKRESPIKMDLMRNWRDQVVAQVKGERNHPSVMIWSIENEWLYINCINLYGGLMDQFEAEVLKVSNAVRAADPTRPTMTDGGAANKDQSMPVCGNHYVFGDFPKYPALAYEANQAGGGRGRWTWDMQRPRFLGEEFFANGINPFDYSYFGGEETFQGKAQLRRAAGIIFRMLTEGYRFGEYGAWHFWMGHNEASDQYNSNAPIAVFCKQWDWTFTSGQSVKRSMGVFNDTQYDKASTFKWELKVGTSAPTTGSRTFQLAPGTHEEFELTLEMPKVTGRQEGQWQLKLLADNQQVFSDSKAVSVLNAAGKPANAAALGEKELLVFDPAGSVAAYLKQREVAFTPLADLKNLPDSGRVLIIGKDALDASDSTSTKLQLFASPGRTVIVLEQKNPVKYQGLPADMEPAANEGRTAFIEDMDHPVMQSLKQKDFFTWGDDQVVYRNAYLKPTRGGKSLVQCHERLANSAMAEVPVGNGLLLVSQLVIGEKLASSAAAQQLLWNLISYGASYKLEYRQVALCTKDGEQLAKVADAIGLQYAKVDDPIAALSNGKKIAVIAATPANLKAIASNLAAVKAFTDAGGWIFFNGLGPEGLPDYNNIVGVDHMIRPFRLERVTFPAVRNPLTAGLTTGDVVMSSGKRMFAWTSDVFLASDVFSFVVDYDDIAPFAKFPESSHFGYADSGDDHNPLNMVNGFVSADGWKYIFSIPIGKGARTDFPLSWPKEQEIAEIEWVGNAFYHLITKVDLTFDGRKDDIVSLKIAPNNEPQTLPISPAQGQGADA